MYKMPQTIVLFYLGPIPISSTVVTTWGVMAVLLILAWLLNRNAHTPCGINQLPEIFVEYILALITSMMGDSGRPYLPFIATIALFVTASNLAGVVPGVTPPTANLATPAAVGVLVFLSVHASSVKTKGFRRYVAHYFEPYWWLFPLNIVGVLSRPASHIFRLYGNMVGGGILVSVAVLLMPWVVPVPIIAWFSVFIGVIQGLVFTLLASAYIAEAS